MATQPPPTHSRRPLGHVGLTQPLPTANNVVSLLQIALTKSLAPSFVRTGVCVYHWSFQPVEKLKVIVMNVSLYRVIVAFDFDMLNAMIDLCG